MRVSSRMQNPRVWARVRFRTFQVISVPAQDTPITTVNKSRLHNGLSIQVKKIGICFL